MMKRIVILTALLLTASLCLTSCISTSTPINAPVIYTEDEASIAMYTAMNTAVINANERFFQKIGTYDFFPEGYRIIKNRADSIPGMKQIIADWNKSVCDYLTSQREILENKTNEAIETIEFNDATAMVKESLKSGSEYAKQLYGEDLKELFSTLVNGIDFSLLQKAVNQYNAWVTTENFLKDVSYNYIEYKESKNEILNYIFNIYTESVATFEELFRTTPDPFASDVCKKVFGIN